MVGPALLVFATVALGTVAAALAIQWALEFRQRREVVRQLRDFAAAAAQAKWLRAIADHSPRVPGLGQVLEQGGLAWTPQSFMVASLGLAMGAALTMLIVFPVWPAVLLAAAGAGALPYLYTRSRRRRRLESFKEQLPEAIDLIGRAMRA